MNFRDFMKQRPSLLEQYPGVLDLTETSVVSALGHMRPEPTSREMPEKAHRCHLAEFWLDAFSLSRTLKPQALISQGVRHSLDILLAHYARQGARALLPADIYPVYLDIAQAHALDYAVYPAEDSLEQALATTTCDVLLVTSPAKPWGRWLDEKELGAIRAWLSGAPHRRVIVDCVYTWDGVLDAQSMALFETGQGYLLHSLSKGWLRPLVMGVALVPEQDVPLWTPVFRNLSLAQDNLRVAQTLLTAHTHFPSRYSTTLRDAQNRLAAALLGRDVDIARVTNLAAPIGSFAPAVPLRYHFIIEQDWEVLLCHHGILALPLSVFGAGDGARSVVTSLRFCSPDVCVPS
jgi:aspartate/methionine/tyrosine aminotransferase